MYLFLFIYSYIIGTNDQHGRGGFWFKHTWLWQLRADTQLLLLNFYVIYFPLRDLGLSHARIVYVYL